MTAHHRAVLGRGRLQTSWHVKCAGRDEKDRPCSDTAMVWASSDVGAGLELQDVGWRHSQRTRAWYCPKCETRN